MFLNRAGITQIFLSIIILYERNETTFNKGDKFIRKKFEKSLNKSLIENEEKQILSTILIIDLNGLSIVAKRMLYLPMKESEGDR